MLEFCDLKFKKLFWFFVFLLGLLFFSLADNGVVSAATTVTGESWPTSGAASSGTTGFSTVTGGTHVGSSDLPSASSSTGYIQGADNTTLGFRIEGTTVPLQSDNDYWLRFWVRPATNLTTLAADGSSASVHYIIGTSTNISNVWYLRNNGILDGFGLLANEYLPGGSSEELVGANVSGLGAVMPLDQWSEVTIHLHKDGKDGEYAIYFNRSLVRRLYNIATFQQTADFTADVDTDTLTSAGHGMVESERVTLTTTGTLPAGLATSTTYYVRNPSTDTFQLSLSDGGSIVDITDTGSGTHTYSNGGIRLSDLGSDWSMNLSGINGITWQVTGPVVTSADSGFSNNPLVDLFEQSSDWVTKVYPSAYNTLTYGGDFWQKTSGSLTATATSYGISGVTPLSKRFVVSGSQSDTATLKTTLDVGTLPFNNYGWATVFFPMIYLPDSGSLSIILQDSSANNLYEVDIDSGYLKQSGSNIVAWTAADRYFLALHFSDSGSVTYSLHDLTAGVASRNFWSGSLADWNSQDLGKIQYFLTRGTTDLEIEGAAIAKWLPLFGVDSLTHANANGITPSLGTINHITTKIGNTYEVNTLPGAMYRYKTDGLPRFFTWGIVGRSGATRQNFNDNILPYTNYSRGLIMTFADGGSINDIDSIDNDEGARTTVVNTLTSQLTQAVSELTSNFNRVWLTTMINRVQGSTYTATERNAILDFDTAIRSINTSYPSTYLSDVSDDVADPSTLFTAGDDTHFNAAGDSTYATYMANDLLSNNTTPFVASLGSASLVDGSSSTDTTPSFTFYLDDGDEDSVSYDLQVDNNSDFSSPEVDYTSSSSAPGSRSYTSSALQDGSYYWRVRSTDGSATSGWTTANSGSVAFIVDTTEPAITIGTPSTSASGATINWNTNESSSSIVEYGLDSSYGNTTSETDTSPRVTSHSVSLSSLLICKTYHYRVRSKDAASNEVVGSDNTFTTTGCIPLSINTGTSCTDQAPGITPPWLYGAAALGSNIVKLYFTEASLPVSKYVLEYGVNQNEYKWGVQDMGVNERGQMVYEVNSLSPNTTYYFRIRAQNGCATGGWSNELSVKTSGSFVFKQLDIIESSVSPVVEKDLDQKSCSSYLVKPGDSLWNIASLKLGNGERYKEIVELNKDHYPSLGLSENLEAGWKLNIGCEKESASSVDNSVPTVVENIEKNTYDMEIKVVDVNDKPVEGANVTIHSVEHHATTGVDGIASFKDIEPGDHKILVEYKNFQGEQSVNLTGSVKQINLSITIEQKPFSLSPLAWVIIVILIITIVLLVFQLKRIKKILKKPL